jgi:nicotinate-nucleotide adenylyltransferase
LSPSLTLPPDKGFELWILSFHRQHSAVERLGLFGGSFDPVHCGHLLVAQAACEELGLTRLFFIPAAQSPFKPESAPAPPAERIRLLRLALAGWNRCEVDEQEIGRGGVSYTIDTVRTYAARHAGAELFYLIGADHVPLLPTWRSAEELAQLVEFVAVPRPAEAVAALPPPFRLRVLRGFPLGVASSQIRARVRAGLPIEGLVPGPVAEAIRNNRLYL